MVIHSLNSNSFYLLFTVWVSRDIWNGIFGRDSKGAMGTGQWLDRAVMHLCFLAAVGGPICDRATQALEAKRTFPCESS